LNEQYQYNLISQRNNKQISVKKKFSERGSVIGVFIGIYGKRSSSPSLTQFDFFHPFNGNTQQQQHHHLFRRNLSPNRTSQIYFSNFNDEHLTLLFNELLTTGLWYVTIINDGLSKQEFQLHIDEIDEKNERLCLNNCNNHGICQQGICICHPSYTGSDCSIGKDNKKNLNKRLMIDFLFSTMY
jgi:hypothetical protein